MESRPSSYFFYFIMIFYLFVSSSFILLNVYCPNLTSLVAGRQPSYLSAGISTRWASKLLKQSLVTMISAPFLSMSLTHLSSAREQDFPQYLKLDNKNIYVILIQDFKVRPFGLLFGMQQAARVFSCYHSGRWMENKEI